MTREPNAIESKSEMNCRTCSFESRCRFVKKTVWQNRVKMICKWYCNPAKGCFDDSGKRKVEE